MPGLENEILLRTKILNILGPQNPTTTAYLIDRIHSDAKKLNAEYKKMSDDIFTRSEKQKIIKNFEKLPELLKQILNLVLFDADSQSLITQPVYFRGEGHIYSASHVTKEGAISCNLLIKVLEALLNMTDQVETPRISAEKKPVIPLYPDPETPRAGITNEQINTIETFYNNLDKTSQAIIDLLCRNTAGKFFYKPVLLPDGYIYDERNAKAVLRMIGKCRSCSDKDITPCHFVAPILTILLRYAEAARTVREALNSDPVNPNPPPPTTNKSACRMM